MDNVAAARSCSSARRTRREQPLPVKQRREVPDEIPPDEIPSETLLAAWTAVFPLSRGPAHRVRLHTGPDASDELVAAIVTDYLRELSERASSGSRIGANGDLFGPPDFDGTPHDVLFMAVFTTDLDAIVRRHSPGSPSTTGSPYTTG